MAYLELVKRDVAEVYKQQVNWYMMGRLKDRPKLPLLLR